jgi:putative flavoprotein involved in K+ transport
LGRKINSRGAEEHAMKTTTTVVIGAGHVGLAMSRCLADRGIDHVILERDEVASSWRTARWDSLRLLTPSWQSRLPGYRYQGNEPDGFMTMPEVIAFIRGFAEAIAAPVQTNTTVTSVRATDAGYRVMTSEGEWRARTVVLANGACAVPVVPSLAADLPTSVRSLAAADYRNPDQLERGGVLVVGASATGVQLADEIHRSGRPVTLAVGGHVRTPRVYRGMDIMWWLDATGVLDESHDVVDDVARVRSLPSFQLVGTAERSTLDVNVLRYSGVRIVGKLAAIRDGTALLSGSLRNQCTLADLKLARLLDVIDEWATARGLDGEVGEPWRPEATSVDDEPLLSLPLASGEIKTVVWATGYRPDFSWLDLPILDRKGYVQHQGGVTPAPGVYVMGMPFLRRRKSTLIDGAADDARDLSTHLAHHLASEVSATACGGWAQPA